MSEEQKNVLRVEAMRQLAQRGLSVAMKEPFINREHVDGPVLVRLNRKLHWLTFRERLMTKFGIWDAWTLEQRLSA